MRSPFLLLFTALLGCGGTTGRRVVLHTELETDVGADRTFVTSLGWTVTLDAAAVSTGALYYYDGEPAFTEARPGPVDRFFAALSPIQVAYAHPGHYLAGNAKGQVLSPYSVDLLGGAAMLPDGEGISGEYRSATFSFASPTEGPALSTLDGHVAIARGTATLDGRMVHFAADADLADIERTAKDGQVTGCVFSETDVEEDGTVTVTVRPKVWFNLVDFAELPEGSAEAPSTLAPDSTARIAFALGLAQLSAYELHYTKP